MNNDQNPDLIQRKAYSIKSHELSEICRSLQLSRTFLDVKNPKNPDEAHNTLHTILEFINREHKSLQLSQVNQHRQATRRERKRKRLQASSVSKDPLSKVDLNQPLTAFTVLETFIKREIDRLLKENQLTEDIGVIILAQTVRTILRKKALWLNELDQELNQNTQITPQKALSKLIHYYTISHEELSEYLKTATKNLNPQVHSRYKAKLLSLKAKKEGRSYINDVVKKAMLTVIKSPFGQDLGVNLNLGEDQDDYEGAGSVPHLDLSCRISHDSLVTEQEFQMGLFAEALRAFFGNQQKWLHQEIKGSTFQGKAELPIWFSYYDSLISKHQSSSSMGSLINSDGKKILGFDGLLNLENVCTETLYKQVASTLKKTNETAQANLRRLRVSLVAILCKYKSRNNYTSSNPINELLSHTHYEYCEKNHNNQRISGYKHLEQDKILVNLVPFGISIVKYKYQKRKTK